MTQTSDIRTLRTPAGTIVYTWKRKWGDGGKLIGEFAVDGHFRETGSPIENADLRQFIRELGPGE